MPKGPERIVSLLLFTLALPAAMAQEADDAPARSGEYIDEITVTGYRPEVQRELMENFVLEIGDPVSGKHGYARWGQRVCVGVFNLPHATIAQYLADKISLIAQDVGLKTGDPGCKPNLQIVFSPDARALADSMVENSLASFLPFGGEGGTTQGRAALERFRSTDAPVRWWQITMVVDELGNPAIALPQVTDPGNTDNGSNTSIPMIRGIASKLRRPTSDAIWGALVIVDGSKVGKVQWPQLAGYLAMVSLAQVNPDAPPAGYESILNLFTADQPPPDLTDMDYAYLRALYRMDTMVMPQIQRGSLVNWMLREQEALRD